MTTRTVYFNGSPDPLGVADGSRLLDALIARKLSVKMLCGGRGLCATCHVLVLKNPHALSPASHAERATLAALTNAQPNSRLACQSQVIADGVEIEPPEGLYIESFADLEQLIGKRTQVPVKHPISGAVLIQAGKLIVRSRIKQLKDFDIDVIKSLGVNVTDAKKTTVE